MATQAQLLANQHNAQQSTGPRTAEGKAVSAKNATKHGLFAQDNVVISENQAQFDAVRDDMLAELDPVGAIESMLAERIVSLTWRLRRAAQMQDEVIDVKIRAEISRSKAILSKSLITGQPCRLSKNTKRCYDDLALGLIAKWDFQADRVLERLSMYERRFEASLFRTMGELKKLKDARKRERAETAETEAASYPGQDARVTRGRDARDTECEKQSQSAAGEKELSSFEKRDYELLIGATPTPNEANHSQQKTGVSPQDALRQEQYTVNRPQRKTLPIDKPVTGVCRY